MRLLLELADRFVNLETGRILYEATEPDEPDEDEVRTIHVPMGFTAIAPSEGTDDDEDDEAQEADCG